MHDHQHSGWQGGRHLARETADALKESGMRKLNLTGRVRLVRPAEACGWIRNED